MLFRLVRPMKRTGSTSHYFVQRIPADLRSRVADLMLHLPVGSETVGLRLSCTTQTIRISLRTADKTEVRARHAAIAIYLDAVWATLRAGKPVPLSHMQATALAGEVYKAWADPEGPKETTIGVEYTAAGWKPFTPSPALEASIWDASALHIASLMEDKPGHDAAKALEERFGPLVDRMLIAKGIPETDDRSRETILLGVGRALQEAFQRRQQNAEGDYSPDTNAARFPDWKPPKTSTEPPKRKTATVPLSTLLEEWWSEAKAAGRSQSTYESYRNTVRKFTAHLKHDDASSVTPADIIAFKDARIKAGVTPKTVKDSDLVGLKSIFKRAFDNGRVAANPAAGVTVMRGRTTRRRSKSFTSAEAVSILRHASAYRRSRLEGVKMAAAKRWVPWLCAYTGARVGEIAQLRQRDVRQEAAGAWVITITPEAGTVKDKKAREVVLHAHLIELGFPDFVRVSGAGYLFLNGGEGSDIRGQWRSVKNRLASFVREVVSDKDVAPNHAWRHLFKTIGRECRIEDSTLDAIQGHAPPSEGGSYGNVTIATMAKAMGVYPRFEVALSN